MLTRVLWKTRTFELLSTRMPLSQPTNTLPAQIAPLEISKKKPSRQPWTQLLTNTPSTLPTSYQMPFECGLVDHEVVAADDAVGLVEDLHRRGVVAGDLLDVVSAKDVLLQQAVAGADDVDALRAGVADEAVPDGEPVAAEVAGHAGAM